MHAIYVPPYKV